MADGTGPSVAPTITVKRTETGFVPGETLYEGDHVVATNITRVTREWRPEDKAAQRFKDDVIRRIEQLFNNTSTGTGGGEDDEESGGGTSPDLFFDSGYFGMKKGEEHTIKHNLGQIPSKFTFFCASDITPEIGTDIIMVVSPGLVFDGNSEWRGFWTDFPTKNTMLITTGTHGVVNSGSTGWVEGNFRVLMWK